MFKNLKIKNKFILAFGIVLLSFAMVGMIFFSSISSAQNNFEDFNEDAFRLSKIAYNMVAEVNNLSNNVSNAIVAPDVALSREYITNSKLSLEALERGLEELAAYKLSNEYTASVNELSALIEEFSSVSSELFALCIALRTDAAADMYFKSFESMLADARTIMENINAQTEAHADAIYSKTITMVDTTTMILGIICPIVLAFTIAAAVYLTKVLTTPILQLETVAKALAQGKLKGASEMVTYESKDELGELAASMRFSMETMDGYVAEISDILQRLADGDLTISFDEITDYLGDFASIKESMKTILRSFNSTITDIYNGSLQVDVGSEQVSSGAQALSQGATEQASAVEELSATIAEVSDQVSANAENAVKASAMSDDAAAGVIKSNDHMRQLMDAMKEIDRTTSQIEKIIKTIEDIAFQTNILALNAAVEAARAGAAGKGFAVVADEVRSLAAKSAEAAQNTNNLIGGTVNAVKNGMYVAGETESALRMVVEKAGDVTVKISEIARVSEDQAAKITQISDGIEQIAAVVHNNSATAEQSAAASEELAGQAALMKELIGKFRLFDGDSSGSSASRVSSVTPVAFAPAEPVGFEEVTEPACEVEAEPAPAIRFESAPVVRSSDKY